jgi:hypothetical protein
MGIHDYQNPILGMALASIFNIAILSLFLELKLVFFNLL